MKFWRLTQPDSDSDYRHSYINGGLSNPFGLPGISCEVCNVKFGGSRVLPFECPQELREKTHFIERWPVPCEQHKALQAELRSGLAKQGVKINNLFPGDRLQPSYLDIPSRPRADFLWASIGSVVVSERIKNLFDSLKIEGVVFCPVILRKVGKREAKLQPPIPVTGEPEDIIEEVPLLKSTQEISPYYELIIQNESNYPADGKPVSICSACGWKKFSKPDRQLVMNESMWSGAHIFFLAPTYFIAVTDIVKTELRKIRATNIVFEPLPASEI